MLVIIVSNPGVVVDVMLQITANFFKLWVFEITEIVVWFQAVEDCCFYSNNWRCFLSSLNLPQNLNLKIPRAIFGSPSAFIAASQVSWSIINHIIPVGGIYWIIWDLPYFHSHRLNICTPTWIIAGVLR